MESPWIKSQGSKINQGPAVAKTLMTHFLNEKASQFLCDAVRFRVIEDSDAPQDD